MRPQIHFLSSVILIFIVLKLYPDLGLKALWLFVGAFLIDFDYYLFYLYTTGGYNLKRALEHYEKHRKDTYQIRVFHTLEFLALMLIGSFYYQFLKLIFIGMILHVILDLFDLVFIKKNYRRRYFFLTNWVREKLIT